MSPLCRTLFCFIGSYAVVQSFLLHRKLCSMKQNAPQGLHCGESTRENINSRKGENTWKKDYLLPNL